MKTTILILLLPLTVDATITINITVHSNDSDIRVNINYTGNDYKVVTDQELKLFNITNERLNKGMRVELGKVPRDIFLKDPTPYGKLFEKFHWEQMKRRLTVKDTKLIDILNEDTVLDTHEHINKTPNNITSKRSMYKVVENRISSIWSKNGLPEDDIFNNITIKFGYGNFSYQNKWRNESVKTTKMPIGVTKKGLIIIKPEQTVVTKLIASKTILLVEIMYEARLTGSVIANYAELYGKYHFWAPSVASIVKAGNMKNEVLTKEIIEVRCFTNPRLQVYDKLTGETVKPPKKKRPRMKILRNKNSTRIVFVKIRKPIKQKKIVK